MGRALRRRRAGVDEHTQRVPRVGGCGSSSRDAPSIWHVGKAVTRFGSPNEVGVSPGWTSPRSVWPRLERLAESRQVDVRWVELAVEDWTAPPDGFDLVAVFYLQLPQPERSVA